MDGRVCLAERATSLALRATTTTRARHTTSAARATGATLATTAATGCGSRWRGSRPVRDHNRTNDEKEEEDGEGKKPHGCYATLGAQI